ncbi:MAG UNVERIFIED_CONTAM: hypothetical protein LVT10_02430 [Anaerolineae bacterium]
MDRYTHQVLDLQACFAPITKFTIELSPTNAAHSIRYAFQTMLSGRPGRFIWGFVIGLPAPTLRRFRPTPPSQANPNPSCTIYTARWSVCKRHSVPSL